MEEKRGPWGEGAAAPVLDSGGCGGRGEKMGVDEVLRLHAGEFGRWQLKHFVLTSTAWALEAFHTMVMIFADREPAWCCIAGAGGASCRAASAGGAAAAGLCGLPAGSWEWWGLVCGAKYKVGLAQSSFFAGCMVGAGVATSRTPSWEEGALTVVCALNAAFGLLTALSPSFWVYAVLRVLTGFSTGGVGLCAFVLATEPVGPSKRGVAGMSTFYFFAGGSPPSLGPFLFRSWRVLYVVTSLPSVVSSSRCSPSSRSPRGVPHPAEDHGGDGRPAGTIAQSNGNGDLVGGIALTVDGDSTAEEETPIRLVLRRLDHPPLRGDILRAQPQRRQPRTSLYLSVFLNAVAEMPAFLLTAAILDRFGRRPLAVATMWLSGAFCLAGAAVGGGTTGAWEMLRLACGTRRWAAPRRRRIWAILAPLVVVLGEKVPFAVFGACGVAGGLVALYFAGDDETSPYTTPWGHGGGREQRQGRIKV
ncbi:unnamed protein product [Spirodela intermedia]|uniref:Uncharacterized protein n=1 Tax=Spirodela intermedia TaxID=51605 RepID=A0A7I8IMG8_SPIIN|nr:unnamed protein product [Spirodela intermedia]CAA6658335.1 unnamed protein product [Spirodela intermedia]